MFKPFFVLPLAWTLPILGLGLLNAGCVSGMAQEPASVTGELDPAVFQSAPAEMTPDIFGKEKTAGPLRILTVEERVGAARQNELVRVPLFFHEGECNDPNGLQITLFGSQTLIPYQADDVRLDADGHVARMHLYFMVNLKPWERQQFQLTPGKNPGATQPVLPVITQGDKVTLAGNDLKLTFYSRGERAGAIAGIETPFGKVSLPDGYIAPAVRLIRQGKNLAIQRENEASYANPTALDIRDVRWASGPLFAKLIVKMGPKEQPDTAEYDYLVPKSGSEFTQIEKLYPEEKNTPETVGAEDNALLKGNIVLGNAADTDEIVKVPAGLRRRLRTVFGFTNDALVDTKAGFSLFMVPYVQQGAHGISKDATGLLNFNGSADFRTRSGSNSGTLRVFFGQVRFIFSKATDLESLWNLSVKSFQPLTAVVDEPWATPDDLEKFARQVNDSFWKIKYWGRSFEANLVMNHLSGKDRTVQTMLEKDPAEKGLDLRAFIPSQEEINDAFKRGQGAGSLDPYNLTYSKSALVPFSAYLYPNDRLDKLNAVNAQAARLVNGRVNQYGWPHVHSFANAANMHMGTYLMAIWGGRKTGNNDLAQWALDATQNTTLRATYGHGQRPYSINPGIVENSDELYISISDLWLRAIELINNEDLSLHPSIYGRYSDNVDVNSDIYQRNLAPDGKASWYRATMFRGQAHDHRWEQFGVDPYLRMVGNAADGGRIGITEACYYMQREVGQPATWNNLMTNVFLPTILVTKALQNYQPAPRPSLPANVQVKQSDGKTTVTWDAVPGEVAGYRIYRATSIGGPWTWVNSPYTATAAYKPPAKAEFDAARAAAATDNESRAAAAGVEVKKLKEKTTTWSKMPEVQVAPLADTLVKGTSFTDTDGKPGSLYFVTAQDKEGRESRWFPEEPVVVAGKK